MINELSYGEYAAQWGCDPVYDKPPRLPGDGCLFYNFSVEQNDPAFLERFIPAIERTILEVKQRDCFDEIDLEDLQELLEYVQGLLEKAKT
jgi:hypothetical protein